MYVSFGSVSVESVKIGVVSVVLGFVKLDSVVAVSALVSGTLEDSIVV